MRSFYENQRELLLFLNLDCSFVFSFFIPFSVCSTVKANVTIEDRIIYLCNLVYADINVVVKKENKVSL